MMYKIYTIQADVEGIAPGRIEAVVEAIRRVADWEIPPEGFRRGESPPEFALRLARSAWDANAAYCPIQVTIERRGRLTDEVFAFDESAYCRLTDEEPSDTRGASALEGRAFEREFAGRSPDLILAIPSQPTS